MCAAAQLLLATQWMSRVLRGARSSRVVVRCVQEEAAARIEAEIEAARDAFEKQMKKGKKDKDKKRAQHDLQKAERLAREKCAKTPVCLRRPS
jgi:hypothetical protein